MTASITYGCSLHYIRLQPLLYTAITSLLHTVTASVAYGYSLALESQAFRALLEGGAPYVRSRVRNLSPLDCIMMGAPLDSIIRG